MMASQCRRWGLCLACGLLVGIGVAAVANDVDSTDRIESLTSDDVSVRVAAMEQMVQQRKATIGKLTHVLRAQKKDADWLQPNTAPNLVIRVLGAMRASEAVPEIVEWLLPPEDGYVVVLSRRSPAGNALIAIGLPSVPNVASLLSRANDEATARICVDVLTAILGEEGTGALLTEEEEKASRPEAKRNLHMAKETLKKLHGKSGLRPNQQ